MSALKPQLLTCKNKFYRFSLNVSKIPLKYKFSEYLDIEQPGSMEKNTIHFCCMNIENIYQLTRGTAIKIACQFEVDIVTVLMS